MAGVSDSDPTPSTLAPRVTDADPSAGADRTALLDELADLTLPLMWTLRQAASRALEPLGLRPGKGLLLGMIASGIASPSTLAELLETTPPTLSSLLSDLEERGLVARRIDPSDRRRVLVEVTDEGRAMTERIREAWQVEAGERTATITDSDLRHLVRIYRTLTWSS